MKGKELQQDFINHPVTAYINGLTSPNSKRVMLISLKSVIALAYREDPRRVDPLDVYRFNWGALTVDKLKALRAALLEAYSERSAHRMFAAVKGVMGSCFDLGLIEADLWMRVQRVKAVSIRSDQKAGRRVTNGEIMALARVCAEDESPSGARDDAIIGLGYTQGPRIGELLSLTVGDYDHRTGDLIIRRGKGRKTRTIRASNSAKASLDEWLSIRGIDQGPIFTRIGKGRRVTLEGISPQGLGKILKARARQAGVSPFTMHDLRRTFITNGWEVGIPGPQLQTIAGHASIETTAAYDRSDLEMALKAGEKLHYPSMRTN